MKLKRLWLDKPSPTVKPTMTNTNVISTSLFLSLPKELVLQIIINVAIAPHDDCDLYPQTLIELSKCCHSLHHLIHHDPWRFNLLWPRAFHERFDTRAIYRRQLDGWDWQKVMKIRCKALYACKAFAAQPSNLALLDKICWEIIWDMITEHDDRNITHLLNYKVHIAAVTAYELDQCRDRRLFPVVLPILSLLVNYDFSITSHFCAPDRPDSAQIVSTELSRFAYNFEAADSLITKHMPLRPFHASAQHTNESPTDEELPLTFYPALDAPAAALHLFFATFFASHPSLYSVIPGCVPIPLFQITSDMFDVEYLRRYERNLFINAHVDDQTRQLKRKWTESVTSLPSENIYAGTGFASASHFVSEAHHIEGDWMGYYSFVDPEEVATEAEDWFDGPMRLSIRIVPLDDVNETTSPSPTVLSSPASSSLIALPSASTTITRASSSSTASQLIASSASNSWPSRWSTTNDNNNNIDIPRKRRKHTAIPSSSDPFPRLHLQECPLTKFEGTGFDNLGNFTVMGLIDDTEDGQVTWEKTYIESGETWEYSGRFALPMGICGRWGDEDYGGPWWIWKTSGCADDSVLTSSSSLNVK